MSLLTEYYRYKNILLETIDNQISDVDSSSIKKQGVDKSVKYSEYYDLIKKGKWYDSELYYFSLDNTENVLKNNDEGTEIVIFDGTAFIPTKYNTTLMVKFPKVREVPREDRELIVKEWDNFPTVEEINNIDPQDVFDYYSPFMNHSNLIEEVDGYIFTFDEVYQLCKEYRKNKIYESVGKDIDNTSKTSIIGKIPTYFSDIEEIIINFLEKSQKKNINLLPDETEDGGYYIDECINLDGDFVCGEISLYNFSPDKIQVVLYYRRNCTWCDYLTMIDEDEDGWEYITLEKIYQEYREIFNKIIERIDFIFKSPVNESVKNDTNNMSKDSISSIGSKKVFDIFDFEYWEEKIKEYLTPPFYYLNLLPDYESLYNENWDSSEDAYDESKCIFFDDYFVCTSLYKNEGEICIVTTEKYHSEVDDDYIVLSEEEGTVSLKDVFETNKKLYKEIIEKVKIEIGEDE